MLAFLTVSRLQEKDIGLPRAQLLNATAAISIAGLLEGSQFLITSRSPSLQDLTAAIAGVLGGAIASRWLSWLGRPATVVLLTVIAAVPFYLQPFVTSAHYQSMALVPFLAYYEFTTLQTVSHVIDLMLIYAPIGFAMQWRHCNAAVSTGIVLIAASIAIPLELAQSWIVGRFPDVTDIVMAVLGALIGAAVARHGLEWVGSAEHRR
jgi:VanZ family protein